MDNSEIIEDFLPSEHDIQFSEVGMEINADFCFQPTNIIYDLGVNVISNTSEARPGFDISFDVILNNYGTLAAEGLLTIEYDTSQLILPDSLWPIIFAEQPGKIEIDFSNMIPLEQRLFRIPMHIKPIPSVQIGDSLIINALINDDEILSLIHI